MKFAIQNYGCQMNVNTADKIRNRLLSFGWVECQPTDTPNAIIFNTCCVRDTAEQKILSHIALAGKQKGKNTVIAVIGCLAEKDKDKLRKKMPYIDIIIGTKNAESVVDAIMQHHVDHTTTTPFTTPVAAAVKDIAYIDITFGCENYCSYCIVPFVRGKLVSRPLHDIIAEFNEVKDNAKTIMLLGQNVNEYYDHETHTDFANLLNILCKIDGDFKINFLSAHPKDFNEKIIKTIAQNDKIAKDIHLPIQSGCDKILKLMNRQYTVAEYKQKVALLRKYLPDVHITTDIICGFPTETDDDFENTVQTVREIKFDSAYIFPYSNRSGTVADKMDGQIPAAIKKARTTKLINIMRKTATAKRDK
ncbi:MAG: MiaB/RimO family radical SAM methylthiotransferase [Christensenellaceae bacterium]|jgi:tRNA-2-methylthio-N6-dimethylallyladenosine synthase|nr:MiaB/RimO family radical SAM methylthiotransferase [Christensenellaceae bacterium]